MFSLEIVVPELRRPRFLQGTLSVSSLVTPPTYGISRRFRSHQIKRVIIVHIQKSLAMAGDRSRAGRLVLFSVQINCLDELLTLQVVGVVSYYLERPTSVPVVRVREDIPKSSLVGHSKILRPQYSTAVPCLGSRGFLECLHILVTHIYDRSFLEHSGGCLLTYVYGHTVLSP